MIKKCKGKGQSWLHPPKQENLGLLYVSRFIITEVHLIPLFITHHHHEKIKEKNWLHINTCICLFLSFCYHWRGWKFGHKSTKEHLGKCSLWQQIDLPSDCVCCRMWLRGAVWRRVACCTNTQASAHLPGCSGFYYILAAEGFHWGYQWFII